MRRDISPVAVVVTIVLAVIVIGAGPAAGARAGTADPSRHPLIGAWLLDLGEDGGRLLTFAADGTVLFTDIDGSNGHGAWDVNGNRAGRFTTRSVVASEDPQIEGNLIFEGYLVIAGDIEVDASGDGWTGAVTVAVTDRSVVRSVDGPQSLTATRIRVMLPGQLGTPAA